jgi:hypothetical protein
LRTLDAIVDRMNRTTMPLLAALLALAAPAAAQTAPRYYVAYRAAHTPRIDGVLEDIAWRAAPWSDVFVDIEGDRKPVPRFATRMKMMWDDRYLYVAGALAEPHVWGTIVDRDSVIFRDNDFELFIDPDGDARDYAELEINALNTVWDLFLTIPYRDGGHADDAWNLDGLRTAVHVAGTLNDPADRDSGWTVEIAIPWRSLERASHAASAPQPGARWRINFSRVEWQTAAEGGRYRKLPGLREDNWVWSPQGVIDMHQPERWGTVEFSPLRADRRPPVVRPGAQAMPGAAMPGAADAPAASAAAGQPALVLSGYRADVGGAVLAYHSPHPEAESALLARARREVQEVTWTTDTVPAALTADTVEFVWIAGLAGSKGLHSFDLSIGGEPRFIFTSIRDSISRDWSVAGSNGARLSFRHTLVDQFDDVFGYMTLRLARSDLRPGAPLVLRVRGADAESQDWYMTFRHRLAAHPRVAQDPVLVRAGASAEAQVRVILDNLAGYREATVEVAGHEPLRAPLQFGANVVRALAGPVTEERDERIVVRFDGAVALDTLVRLHLVAQRDVYVLPYSHNDIGYSDVQERVERKQWHNIDDALRLIERTRGYPLEARYRWNVEILWPVTGWLAQASPERRERFLAAVRDGSIGLNALTAGVLSGLATLPEMLHFLDDARGLRATYGLPITTAVISDIPGQSWGMVTALARSDVRYFAIAPNSGDRVGYTLETWGDRPFWWTSPSGRDSVLTWVAGASYSAFHMAPMRIQGERVLFSLMRRLEAERYPYRHVQLPYTIFGDNGPNDDSLPDVVRGWNARYVSPRLIIATHGQMFRDFVAQYGGRLPAFGGDFTGYWEDGAASTAREVAMVRAASDRLVQAEALWPLRHAREPFPALLADSAWRDVTLWDEHTWGAAASVETPDAPDVIHQWEYKRRFAVLADSLSRLALARSLGGGRAVPNAFDVYNASAWPRTDLVLVPAELSRGGDRVVGPDGRAVPSQRLSTGELAVLVRQLPPLARRRYTVIGGTPFTGPATGAGGARAGGATLESPLLRLTVDTLTGAIESVVWKSTGADLVDRTHRSGLGEYLYVPGRDSTRATGIAGVRVRALEPGPLVATLLVEAERTPGARRVVREIRVVSGLDRVDLAVMVDKLPVREREGVHLAFPLRVPGGQLRFDVATAVVRPDSDQLAGSSRNVVNVQSWVDVSNDSLGVTWASVDAPLVEIGGLNAESPWMRSLPPTQTFFSYVMNNYWHTNYKADQDGPVTFRYALRPHRAFSAEEASRFGMAARRPLLVAPAAGAPR